MNGASIKKWQRSVFLLDGYNIIYASEWIRSGNMTKEREKLYFLAEKIAQATSSSVFIFFDGSDPCDLIKQGPVKVIYTDGTPADEKIKEKALQVGKKACVVTYDQEILSFCRKNQISHLTPNAWSNLLPLPDEKPQKLSASEVFIWEQIFAKRDKGGNL